MNKTEKDQVIRIVKNLTEQRINSEAFNVRVRQETAIKERELKKNKPLQDLLNKYNKAKLLENRYEKERKRCQDQIINKVKHKNIGFIQNNGYGDGDKKGYVRPDSFPIQTELKKKLRNKRDDIIIKILSAGTDKQLMKLVEEFKKFVP